MLCKDLMRRPVQTVDLQESAQAIARKMRDESIGFVPVRDRDGRMVGVVTDRDIALRVCATGVAPGDRTAEEVMTRDVVTCRETDDLTHVERLMSAHRKSRIPVVDEQDRPLGVISLSDIAASDDPGAVQTLRNVARREVIASPEA